MSIIIYTNRIGINDLIKGIKKDLLSTGQSHQA